MSGAASFIPRQGIPDLPDAESSAGGPAATTHQPPTIVRLGSLAELTLGGTVGTNDGFGGAGDASNL